jgi:hypothetical protein
MISMSLIVSLVVAGLVFWILWWGLGAIGLPQPFDKIIRVILIVCVVLFLINLLLGIGGGHQFSSGPIFTR